MQINKSDRNDAVGIARIMQCGWYKAVHVKDLDSHATKALLVSRALLVKIKRDLENQIRGLLKNLGLVIGRAKMNVFAARAAELAEARPELAAAVEPLLKAREAVGRQIADLDRKVMRLARNDAQVRRFMTNSLPRSVSTHRSVGTRPSWALLASSALSRLAMVSKVVALRTPARETVCPFSQFVRDADLAKRRLFKDSTWPSFFVLDRYSNSHEMVPS
jgi:transposase